MYVTGIGAKLKEKLKFLDLANVVLHFSCLVWSLRQRHTKSTSSFYFILIYHTLDPVKLQVF